MLVTHSGLCFCMALFVLPLRSMNIIKMKGKKTKLFTEVESFALDLSGYLLI